MSSSPKTPFGVVAGSLVPGESKDWHVSPALQNGKHVGVVISFCESMALVTLTDDEALTLAAKLANATDDAE